MESIREWVCPNCHTHYKWDERPKDVNLLTHGWETIDKHTFRCKVCSKIFKH